jgi:hypothetical protein
MGHCPPGHSIDRGFLNGETDAENPQLGPGSWSAGLPGFELPALPLWEAMYFFHFKANLGEKNVYIYWFLFFPSHK